MSFSLKSNENSVNKNNTNKKEVIIYQKPGIYDNVRVESVVFGKSTFKQTPYIRLNLVGQDGEQGKSAFMYLNTKPSPGNTVAAWEVTARNLASLVAATNNISKADAEAIELVPTNEPDEQKQYDMLVRNLTDLLVGKPFRAKFKGEQTKENGIVYATLDKVESMNIPRGVTGLKFDEKYDIKYYNVQQAQAQAIPVKGDLPF